MNTLPAAGENRWRLPRHAHVVVYEADAGDELLTVYDCGAAQKPPSAQVVGNLVRVRPDHDVRRAPTGYVVTMREPSALVRQDEVHWRIDHRESGRRPAGGDADGNGRPA